MCVDTLPKAKILKKVVGYKMFMVKRKKLHSLIHYTSRPYKIGKIYKSYDNIGYQAFVFKQDAKLVSEDWSRCSEIEYKVVRVYLFNAKQGTISNMSYYANGKQGLIAPEMIIPRRSRKRK